MPSEKRGWFHLPRKHKKIYFVILVILIGTGIYFWPRPQKQIETQKVIRQNIVESISSTGTVDSQTSVDLTFVVGGKLVYLGAKKGDLIKKGQVIGILDQRSVQKNLESDLRDYSLQRNNFDQTNSNNQNRTPQQALNDDMKRILQNNQYNLDKAVISVELQDLAKQQTVLTSPIDGILLSEDIDVSGVNLTPATSFVVPE